MTSIPRDRLRPGDEVFRALGWEGGPEFLDRDLAGLFNIYAADPSTNFAAFETLAAIADYWWSDMAQVDRPDPNFGMPPMTPVTVPWWVVHLLGRCWRNYLTEPGKKAGEAFRLEGGGQGKKRRIDKFLTEHRNRLIALAVAFDRDQAKKDGRSLSVETAVFDVSEKFGIPSDTVWAAWKKHGAVARRSLANYQSYGKNLAKSMP